MGVQKTPILDSMSLPIAASTVAKDHLPDSLRQENCMESPVQAGAFKIFRPPSLTGIVDAIWDLDIPDACAERLTAANTADEIRRAHRKPPASGLYTRRPTFSDSSIVCYCPWLTNTSRHAEESFGRLSLRHPRMMKSP